MILCSAALYKIAVCSFEQSILNQTEVGEIFFFQPSSTSSTCLFLELALLNCSKITDNQWAVEKQDHACLPQLPYLDYSLYIEPKHTQTRVLVL